MTFVQWAALIQVVISLIVMIFQIALTFGAPWGEYTMGGQNTGVLPKKLRVAAAVSAVIMLAQAGHFLAQAGILNPLLSPELNTIVNWFWFGFAVLGLGANAISRSKKGKKPLGSRFAGECGVYVGGGIWSVYVSSLQDDFRYLARANYSKM